MCYILYALLKVADGCRHVLTAGTDGCKFPVEVSPGHFF